MWSEILKKCQFVKSEKDEIMAIFVPFLTHCNSIRIMSWFLDRKQARKCIFTSILKVDEGREFLGDAAGWHIGSNLKSPPPPCCGSNFPINRDFCGFFFYIKTTTRSVLLNVVVNATYMLGMNHWSNLLEKISGKLSVNDRLDSDMLLWEFLFYTLSIG